MTLKSCHDDRDPGPKKLLVLENSWSWKTLHVSRVMNAMRRVEYGDCRNELKFRVPLASRCLDKDFDVRYILLASGLILDASLTGRAVDPVGRCHTTTLHWSPRSKSRSDCCCFAEYFLRWERGLNTDTYSLRLNLKL